MKRIAALAVLAVATIAAVVYAAPDVDPWRSIYEQRRHIVPQRFDTEVRAQFIDAGVIVTPLFGAQTVIAVHIDAGAVRVQGTYVPIAAPDDGGVAQQRLQYGYGVLSSNDYAVTFNPAFGAIPACVCSSINATAAACGVKATPSSSAVTFRGANASDAIFWQCAGIK